MALSTYFNLDSQVSTFFHEGTPTPTPTPALALAPEQHHYDQSFFLLNPNNNTTFDYSSYFDHTASFLYPEEIYPHFLPNCPSAYYDPNNIFPTDQDFLSTPCSKRQKCFYDDQSSLMNLAQANFFDGVVQNPCYYSMQSEELPLLPEAELYSASAMPEFSASPQQLFSQGGCAFGASRSSNDDEHHHHRHHEEKKSNERITISAQSLAARERRRKITEKTQELGKLVPGGSKMNTAEMLHAAGKYVQFLQAQVEMLQLMKTLQEEEAAPSIDHEHLQALLVSPSLQEKMYSEEKCFVPKDFVTALTNHDNVRSCPSILKDLKQLLIATDN